MTSDQLSKSRLQIKEEQRAAIQLLRMIGSSDIQVLLNQKDNLYESSLRYAKMERPDFILLKEALLAYEKIIVHKQSTLKLQEINQSINEEDKKYFFTLLTVVVNTFGTDETEWFCATETILNTLFNIKTRNQPEYAKSIIQ